MLDHDRARAVYDRIGAAQDTQGFYERPALDALMRHADFEHARAVFEFGCGTGRLASRLLEHHLPPEARYHGIDLSTTMVRLARRRLARFGERASVVQCDGTPRLDVPDGTVDRCLSTYVLDLLPEPEIRIFLEDARRALAPHGRLCLVGLTAGAHGLPRLVTHLWTRLQRMAPALVGGCRPIELRAFVTAPAWRIEHAEVITSWAVPSEILVASPA